MVFTQDLFKHVIYAFGTIHTTFFNIFQCSIKATHTFFARHGDRFNAPNQRKGFLYLLHYANIIKCYNHLICLWLYW